MTAPAPLVTLAGVKAQLNIPADDTRYDAELGEYIDAATVLVEEYRNEAVVLRQVTDRFNLIWASQLTLRTTPVARIVSATRPSDGATWTLRIDDASAGLVSVDGAATLSGDVEIVYEAGYATIPANIALAAKLIVAHLWEPQQQPGIGPRPIGGGPAGEDTMTASGLGWGLPDRAIALLGKRPPLVA